MDFWNYIDDNYYFFSRVSYTALNGVVKVDGYTYTFEDYKLVRGDLVTDSRGVKYYWAGALIPNGWQTIDGYEYYFRNGYAYTGVKSVETSRFSEEYYYYLFDVDGKMICMLNGLYEGIYYQEGEKIPYLGLVYFEGYYYYINDGAKPVKDRTYFVTNTNDLCYSDGTPIKKGSYVFDEEGRMVMRNGLIDGYYYENNVKVPYAGLIEQDGYFYYINDNAKPVAGKTYFVTKTNDVTYADGTPIKKGSYVFDEEGRMVMRNGLIDGYYYENNVKVPYAGLIEQDGYFYYINDNAKPVAGKSYFITKTNDLTWADGTPIKKASYVFDEEGRMVMRNGLIDGYYYENNVKVPYAGLIEQDGYFYYINDNAKPVVNRTYFVSKTNDLTLPDGTPIKKGTYTFDELGRMIIN